MADKTSQFRLNDISRLRLSTHFHAPPACDGTRHDPSCPEGMRELGCHVISIDTSGGKGERQPFELAICTHFGSS